MHDVSVRVLGKTERLFKNTQEMQMNEVCISLSGRERDFENIYVLTVDDNLAARMAANAIDLFFDDDVEGVTITMVDKNCKGIQFEL